MTIDDLVVGHLSGPLGDDQVPEEVAILALVECVVNITDELFNLLGAPEVVKLDEASGNDFRPRVPDLWVG